MEPLELQRPALEGAEEGERRTRGSRRRAGGTAG
jgi:hypothetical protein